MSLLQAVLFAAAFTAVVNIIGYVIVGWVEAGRPGVEDS